MKINNRDARPYVQKHRPFRGHNTFAEIRQHGERSYYVVYSYGYHWPMFAYDQTNKYWLENGEKWGPTTSKQHSQLHPHEPTTQTGVKFLRELIGLDGRDGVWR
jgi:hypothetical protein